MSRRYSLSRIGDSWWLIIVLASTFLFITLYAFPSFQAEFNQIAGTEIKSLDTRLWYSQQDILALFQILQEDGRDKLRLFSGVVDMIYPLVYGALFFLLLKKLAGSFSTKKSWLKYVCFLPIIAAVFDYIENINILIMLDTFPNISSTQVMLGSAATSLK
ncbi:hypothetical protein CR969_01815 [Candidatus Saccharibacteria bacterium]|nr:MAG: hypothetical protein CR969_01815 [Candidatus Saccharibacteria bacterium]